MKFSILLLALASCTMTGTSTATQTDQTRSNCAMVSERLKLVNQEVSLPAIGRFVLESHLTAVEDGPDNWYPTSSTDGIEKHLSLSCASLPKGTDCSKVYASQYTHVWTPAEGGLIGQGSNGNLKPPISQEVWSANMYWTAANKPKPGTKFLACNMGKCVVTSTGWETGPSSPTYIGGLQGEVMYFLGADNTTKMAWGRLVDQSQPLGPISCN